jgi:hypothetical protein
MTDTTKAAAIVAITILLIFAIALIFLRQHFKKGSVKVGTIGGSIETHKPSGVNTQNINQISEDDSNEAKIKAKNASIKNIKQKAKKKNVLEIGDR